MNLAKNIRNYYFYSVFSELIIIGPILVLFMVAKGLSFTEITILQSICAIAVVIFDLPTGALADKIGRKYSMFIGSMLWGIGLSIYVFGEGFILFSLAEIIFSLGTCFKSGADTALIYDSLKDLDREKDFALIDGKAKAYSLYAQAIGSIIAGYLYGKNMHLPILVSCGFMTIAAIFALFFVEKSNSHKREVGFGQYFEQIKESWIYIKGHEKIKAILFYSMIFYIFNKISFWYYQPYMQAVKIPVQYFGVIFFVFNIVAAISSRYSKEIMDKTKPRTLTFMSLLLIISFILLGIINVWIGVAAILLQQIARGIYPPVTRKYLNKHIPSEKRATILSFQSFTGNIAVGLAFPFAGKLKDSTDIFTTHLVVAGVMIVLTYITIRYMNTRLGVKEKKIEGLKIEA